MSDKSTSIQNLKDRIHDFCKERDWDQFHSPKDLAIGACTESAELLEVFRFMNDEQCLAILKDEKKREAIGDELADVFFFLLRFSEKYNFDLVESFNKKMTKNEQKYSVERSRGKNQKYTEL